MPVHVIGSPHVFINDVDISELVRDVTIRGNLNEVMRTELTLYAVPDIEHGVNGMTLRFRTTAPPQGMGHPLRGITVREDT